MTRAALALALGLLAGGAAAQNYDFLVSSQPGLTNSAATVKATKGPLIWVSCYNPNATDAWVQFFDTAGAVTVGTTTPTRSYVAPALSATGFLPGNPQTGGAIFAALGMQVAAATTATGGTAPGTALNCDFAYR